MTLGWFTGGNIGRFVHKCNSSCKSFCLNWCTAVGGRLVTCSDTKYMQGAYSIKKNFLISTQTHF
jgi:hypothetical protein